MPKNVRELYVDPSQRDRFQEIFQREGKLINAIKLYLDLMAFQPKPYRVVIPRK